MFSIPLVNESFFKVDTHSVFYLSYIIHHLAVSKFSIIVELANETCVTWVSSSKQVSHCLSEALHPLFFPELPFWFFPIDEVGVFCL